MRLEHPSPQFEDAVAAVCHGTASAGELRALNELLRRDHRARDEYLLRVALHARLASDPELFASTAATAAVEWRGALEAKKAKPSQTAVRTETSPVKWLWPALAMAATLALIAVTAWGMWRRSPKPDSGAASSAVAMLVRSVDARWGQGTPALRMGSPLPPGLLRLEAGMAQVVFYQGARMVFEGPAELRLVSVTEAELASGRLLAEIPPPARGFRLRTAQGELMVPGSAFGVATTPEQTEVQVFDGEVELRPLAGLKQLLPAGEGAVLAAGNAVRRMEARRSAFASLLAFHERSLAAAAFRYERWQFANASRQPDPNLLVHLDFLDFDLADRTFRNTAQSEPALVAGTVIGGERVEGRWREKPALEFRGVNDRVRLDVPGEFDALTLSAWVLVKGLDRQFNALFMCDGFATGTIHWLIRRDGVLGLTVFGSEPGQFQILASPPVITVGQLGLWTHLAVVLDGPGGRVTHYLDGMPVSRHFLEVEPPFRIGPAELGNWNGGSEADPHPMLIRSLSGVLDEFELFSRALSEQEIRELYARGNPDL